MAPQRCPNPNPQKLWMLHGEREIKVEIGIKIANQLMQEIILDYAGGFSVIQRVIEEEGDRKNRTRGMAA